MEEIKIRKYNELLCKEKNALWKEYNCVNPRSKFWFSYFTYFVMACGGLFIIIHLHGAVLFGISIYSFRYIGARE